jgi:hypothetical protein
MRSINGAYSAVPIRNESNLSLSSWRVQLWKPSGKKPSSLNGGIGMDDQGFPFSRQGNPKGARRTRQNAMIFGLAALALRESFSAKPFHGFRTYPS